MPACVIVGAQWGDEGKGKIVDLFTERSDVVVRYQGGNNAGHTLVIDRGNGPEKTVLHQIPSGIFHPSKTCVIASGVVLDVEVLFVEVERIRHRNVEIRPEQLRISADAHVIMPYHKALDIAREASRGEKKIGTTGRGIGPTYEDRVARRGVRLRDLLDPAQLRARLESVLPERNAVLSWYGAETFEMEPMIARFSALGAQLAPFVDDCREILAGARGAGRRILYEGAQGTMLDIAHGTYPFVTSSNTTAAGACTGAGVPPSSIDAVVGITKAYATRVGAGPFPTELFDEMGDALRKKGDEFGATTGRPRRCGWFDAPAMRYAHRLNHFTGLAITKLDVLTGFEEVRIAVAYELDGQRLEVASPEVAHLERVVPVWESLPGWSEPITEAKSMDDLPANARRFLDRISELCGVPLALVSVGPERGQTIVLQEPFAPR